MMDSANMSDTLAIFYRQTSQVMTASARAPAPGSTMLDGWTPLVQVIEPWESTETERMPEFDDSNLIGQPPDELFEKVERAKREWEATVDSLPDLVCLIDRNGCVI